MKKNILLLILSICFSISSYGQRPSTNYGPIDVQNYEFHISVNDNNNDIHGETKINLIVTSDLDSFSLDFESVDETNKGMIVTSVTENGNPIKFEHQNNTLTVYSKANSGEQKTFLIKYHGVPKDGMVISKNKYGERTFLEIIGQIELDNGCQQ